MGFALPASIGIQKSTNKLVLAVIGDGSIMMNLQELQTLKFHNIPAKIFIINNNVYAVIRKRQKELFRKRSIGTDKSNGVSCPDFKKIAKAFDINYALIPDNNNLEATFFVAQKIDSGSAGQVQATVTYTEQ